MSADDRHAKLYKAVQEYIEAEGGSVVVIGGVSVIQEPADKPYKYFLAVRITGKLPTFADDVPPLP